ncbi:hypothetical protein [Streptomyces sp. NPDC003077]|uniref:hypothetical protein n=1 Tax=Streptomyces sp. NPDC003077 TaxID=3154443 RepID=UPI0033AEC34C
MRNTSGARRAIVLFVAVLAVLLVRPGGATGPYDVARPTAAAVAYPVPQRGGADPSVARNALDGADATESGIAYGGRGRRGGRCAVGSAASPLAERPLSLIERDVAATVPVPQAAAVLAGRRAAPLTRSDELPLKHGVFRC